MRKNSLVLNPSVEQIPKESFALIVDFYESINDRLEVNGVRMDTREYVKVYLEPTLFNTESPRLEQFMNGGLHHEEPMLVKSGGVIHVHKASRIDKEDSIPLYQANWLSKVAQTPPEMSYEPNGHLNHSLALPFLGAITEVLHENRKKTAFARFVLDDTVPGQFDYLQKLDGVLAQGLSIKGQIGTLRLSKGVNTLEEVADFTQEALLRGKGLVVRIVNQDGSIKATLIEPIASELSLKNKPQLEAIDELLHHLNYFILANERGAEGQTIELMPVHTFNFGKKATQRLQQERIQHHLKVLNPVDELAPFLSKGVLSARNYLSFELLSQSVFITDVAFNQLTLDNVWANQCQQLAILPPAIWNKKNFRINQQVGLALECLVPLLVYVSQKNEFDLDEFESLLDADYFLNLRAQGDRLHSEGYTALLERLEIYIQEILKDRPSDMTPEQELLFIKAVHTTLKPFILKSLIASGGLQLQNMAIMKLIPTPEQLARYPTDLCVEPYTSGFEPTAFEQKLEQDLQQALREAASLEIPAAEFETVPAVAEAQVVYDNSEQHFRAHSYVQIETVVENTAACPIISIETQSGKLLHGRDNFIVEASADSSQIAHKRELVVDPQAYQSFLVIPASTKGLPVADPVLSVAPTPKPSTKPKPLTANPYLSLPRSPFAPPTPHNHN